MTDPEITVERVKRVAPWGVVRLASGDWATPWTLVAGAKHLDDVLFDEDDHLTPEQAYERLEAGLVECPNCGKNGTHPGGHHGICNLCQSTGTIDTEAQLRSLFAMNHAGGAT